MKIKVQNQIKSAHQSSKLKYKSKIKTLFQVQSEKLTCTKMAELGHHSHGTLDHDHIPQYRP